MLLGADGQHYQCRLPEGTTMPVVAEDDAWQVDPNPTLVDELID